MKTESQIDSFQETMLSLSLERSSEDGPERVVPNWMPPLMLVLTQPGTTTTLKTRIKFLLKTPSTGSDRLQVKIEPPVLKGTNSESLNHIIYLRKSKLMKI